MDPLPYRATVLLKHPDVPCQEQYMELMERSFAKETDAVVWCRVMTEAEPKATGVWFVAVARGGRLLRIARENGLLMSPTPGADVLGDVLGESDLPVRRTALELVPSA